MDVLLRYGADLSVEEQAGLTPSEFATVRNANPAANKIKRYGMPEAKK